MLTAMSNVFVCLKESKAVRGIFNSPLIFITLISICLILIDMLKIIL